MTRCWVVVGRLVAFSGSVSSPNPVTTRRVGDTDWTKRDKYELGKVKNILQLQLMYSVCPGLTQLYLLVEYRVFST